MHAAWVVREKWWTKISWLGNFGYWTLVHLTISPAISITFFFESIRVHRGCLPHVALYNCLSNLSRPLWPVTPRCTGTYFRSCRPVLPATPDDGGRTFVWLLLGVLYWCVINHFASYQDLMYKHYTKTANGVVEITGIDMILQILKTNVVLFLGSDLSSQLDLAILPPTWYCSIRSDGMKSTTEPHDPWISNYHLNYKTVMVTSCLFHFILSMCLS